MLKNVLFTLAFIIYGLGLTTFLLVLRFPVDDFLGYISAQVAEKTQRFSLRIEDVSYRYPLTLNFSGVTLVDTKSDLILPVDQLTLRPDLSSPTTRFFVGLTTIGARLDSLVRIEDGWDSIDMSDISLSGLDIEKVADLFALLDRRITGLFSFTGSFRGAVTNFKGGSLRGQWRLTEAAIGLKRPILATEELTFSELASTMEMRDGVINIRDGTAAGSQFFGEFNGMVRLGRQWELSVLEIGGELQAHEEYIAQNELAAQALTLLYRKYNSRALPIQVYGTILAPEFRFGPVETM
jgi:type II secretion system protein N